MFYLKTQVPSHQPQRGFLWNDVHWHQHPAFHLRHSECFLTMLSHSVLLSPLQSFSLTSSAVPELCSLACEWGNLNNFFWVPRGRNKKTLMIFWHVMNLEFRGVLMGKCVPLSWQMKNKQAILPLLSPPSPNTLTPTYHPPTHTHVLHTQSLPHSRLTNVS